MDEFRHKIAMQVRFRDCDMMGHVNNAVYLTYFEEARASFWKGLMGQEFQGFNFILAEVMCTFHRPAKMGETLQIGTRVSRIGSSSFDVEYLVCDPSGQKVASGRSVQVMYDYELGRTIPIPGDLKHKMQALSDPAP